MLGFDAVGKLTLAGLPASSTGPGSTEPFAYVDWRTHPPVQKPSEPVFMNLIPGLRSQPGLVFGTVSIPNFDHPPPYVKGAEFVFPNVAIASFQQLAFTFVPYSFYRHPPIVPKGPDTIFPNILTNLNALPVLSLPLVPFDFNRHPPRPPKGPDTVFPNFLTNLESIPVLSLTLVPFDFNRHAPPYVKGAEFIFPNLSTRTSIGLKVNLLPLDFYRHPPPFVKGSEFTFPNLALEALSVPPAPIPSSLNQRIRKAKYVLQEIRQLGRVLYR